MSVAKAPMQQYQPVPQQRFLDPSSSSSSPKVMAFSSNNPFRMSTASPDRNSTSPFDEEDVDRLYPPAPPPRSNSAGANNLVRSRPFSFMPEAQDSRPSSSYSTSSSNSSLTNRQLQRQSILPAGSININNNNEMMMNSENDAFSRYVLRLPTNSLGTRKFVN